MRIGDIELKGEVALAPMAGVTDAAMRLLCFEQGASWSVSEMLSAKGWIFSKGKSLPALDILKRLPGEGIAGLQLFGREPEYISAAIRELEPFGYEFFDLNFGCPAPKITGNGEGSAMMREPKLIGRVVSAAVNSTKLPVTAKIRAGWDDTCINAPLIAAICQDNGAVAIAVHGRTRQQQYHGKADWSVIRGVKKAVNIPVIGNGDVKNFADARRMCCETGADAAYIARSACGNPWAFRADGHAPDRIERIEMAIRHLKMEIGLYGEKRGLLEMRKHIAWYITGMRDAASFRQSINTMTSVSQVLDALNAFKVDPDI